MSSLINLAAVLTIPADFLLLNIKFAFLIKLMQYFASFALNCDNIRLTINFSHNSFVFTSFCCMCLLCSVPQRISSISLIRSPMVISPRICNFYKYFCPSFSSGLPSFTFFLVSISCLWIAARHLLLVRKLVLHTLWYTCSISCV